MTDVHTLGCRIDRATQELDLAALDQMLSEMYQPAPAPDQPFGASLALRPEYQDVMAQGPDAGGVIGWANRIARARRWVSYKLTVTPDYDGHIVVDEGDSWFQYPLLLTDTVDHLSAHDGIAVRSLSGAGHLVRAMAEMAEYRAALRKSRAPVMMLSGGGNDIFANGGLADLLHPWADGMRAQDVVRHEQLDQVMATVMAEYHRILADVAANAPDVRVLGHGYDLPYPQRGGAHLGHALDLRGVPMDAGREAVGLIIARFNEELFTLEQDIPHFRFVDLRGVVDLGENSWFDELHPKDAGFGRVAEAFRTEIESGPRRAPGSVHLMGAAPSFDVDAPNADAEAPAYEGGPGSIIVLDPGHGGSTPPFKLGGSSWNNAVGPQGTLEKTLTLDVSRRAKAILEARGRTVVLTRDSDVNLSLAARARVASVRRADVFVSVHFNGSRSHSAQGTETFVHPTYGPASAALCQTVQNAMVQALGHEDRNRIHGGVKVGKFGVINGLRHSGETAAILHEVSFLDRVAEEERLFDTAYRDKIACALADGIEAYLGGGLEAALEADITGEYGDAIESHAAETGEGVTAYLGAAESVVPVASAPLAPPPSALFPHSSTRHVDQALSSLTPVDPTPPPEPSGAERFAHWLRASSHRRDPGHVAGGAADPMNDVNEFREVEIGSGLDLEELLHGDNFARAARSLSQYETAASHFDLAGFEEFIRGLNLRYFVPAEFLELGESNASGACAGLNRFPPRHLWPNIARTAQMLDEIRHRLEAPVRISSCFRAPSYNACVGGATQSLHMTFNAVDWHCVVGTPSRWAKIARQVRASDARFAGGIGIYHSFVHVDTRGYHADF